MLYILPGVRGPVDFIGDIVVFGLYFRNLDFQSGFLNFTLYDRLFPARIEHFRPILNVNRCYIYCRVCVVLSISSAK